jgi:hypothetical protein
MIRKNNVRNRKMVIKQFICESCDEEFEISWNDEHVVRHCPFCGDFLNEDEEEDDEDKDDDEDEWE